MGELTFCENCGAQLEAEAAFCSHCGLKAPNLLLAEDKAESVGSNFYYGVDWSKRGILWTSSDVDLVLDSGNLSLVRLPKYHFQTLGIIIGLVILNIIGAVIGSMIGESKDAEKRRWYRSAWLDENGKLISRAYEKDILVRVPLSGISDVSIRKNKFSFIFGEEKFTLKKNQTEMKQVAQLLKSNVL